MEVRLAGAAQNVASDSSDDDDSVTDIGAPAVVRIPSLKIERGAVLAGRYQVEAAIGKGGSGIVLRAFDRMTQVPVAIKILNPELARDPKWLERFSRELRLARQIQHPNVCRVFDIGESDGHWFLTMELAGAGTLRESLLASNAVVRTPAQKLADARAAIAGLAAIHGAEIIHRDIKPENFLRMEDGRLLLSDFGLAAVRSESNNVTIMVGTPSYMAPEVVMGEPATARSDVWSLGVVLHEIFFGQRPHWEPRNRGGRRLVRPHEGPVTSFEKAVFLLCETCTADNPRDRLADAVEVSRSFEGIGERGGLPGGLPRRRRVARLLGVGMALGALALLVLTRRHLWSRAEATSSMSIAAVLRHGQAADWAQLGTPLASLPGRVHCLSALQGGRVVRAIWGAPRQAEDFDLSSAGRVARRSAPLARESFEAGCPQISPDERSLLFASYNEAGVAQIRISDSPSGERSRVLTAGYEPVWMASGEEFLFTIDTGHAAIFSLPTMSFTLIGDDPDSTARAVEDKAVSPKGDLVALLRLDAHARSVLSIYASPGLQLVHTLSIPPARGIAFAHRSDDLLVSYEKSDESSSIVRLDWRRDVATNVGFVPGFEVTSLASLATGSVVVARKVLGDVWIDDGHGPQQFTSDGQNATASVASSGEVLVGKRSSDGRYVIWKFDAAGGRPITSGPYDVMPAFAPDGTRWAYIDYSQKGIVVCSSGGSCRVARKEPLLPAWPTFSPDGATLAYLSQLNTPRLFVLSVQGAVRDIGPALADCPPVWSSNDQVWVHERSGKQSYWVERSVRSALKTGRRVDFPAGADPDACWWPAGGPNSPFFRSARVERHEVSTLLRLPAASSPD